MKIVSLVPSWTETLIEAGVDVVGRTRFCINPAQATKAVPIVGGTKDVDWEKVKALNPDLVIFDREENTLTMAEECPVKWHSTHIRHMQDMPRELHQLAKLLDNSKLALLAESWQKVVDAPPRKKNLALPPGLVKWVTPPPTVVGSIVYVIWANPWMAAGHNTFIGSVMEWCGWPVWGSVKYPKFNPADFDKDTLFLCSTEPFPFAKRLDVISQLPGATAIVDGESISWFGSRSLTYLNSLL